MNRRVVITGIGAVTPLGVGAEALIERWSAGECAIAEGAARCSDFEPTDFIEEKEARRQDRFTQFAVAAGGEAVDRAGWAESLPYDPGEIGCVIGTGIGGLGSLEEQQEVLREQGAKRVSPLAVPLLMGNAAAAALAMQHGVHGQTYGVISACAAGAHAIGAAARMIASGDAEAALTGGAEAALTPLALAAFARMRATSRSGISRPFDARRDGFVMGEGAAVLVLEEAAAAERRGANVLGEVLGYGATADAHHMTAPEPTGAEAARAIALALEDAGLEPGDVDYVNAHGTSTPLNDRSETEALKTALGQRAHEIPVSSTKSVIGHLLGAAGAVEAVATVLALQRRLVPPTVGWEEREEGLDLDYVPGEARPLAERDNGNGGRPPVAISNSFGFGGHNAVLCLGAR